MGIRECCSAFLGGLPDPALPLMPSMALGMIFAALILVIFYKKENKVPLKTAVLEILRKVFYLFPTPDHSESQSCRNSSCVRCSKYKELEQQIAEKWRALDTKTQESISLRLRNAVQTVVRRLVPSSEKLGKDRTRTSEREKSLRSVFQKPTIFPMDLAANPYWNEFDVYGMELRLLKLNFSIILKEFESVFEALKGGDNWGWKLNDIPRGHWCIFPFIDQGVVSESNCKRCPNTSTMIGSLPSVMKDCVFGNACFSVLYPDSHIEPHYGPTNLRLRCHLGLKIPSDCWLEVNGTQHNWKSEETVVFDDSFEHSATFSEQSSAAQASPRAVLIIDFWHPDITKDEKKILLDLLSP
ncbi:aspartate beta-hydroxylase domain-containing protein 2 [Penaeus vannamei]|uniref:Putative aspartate beta-hydroxylase domain-containing protein 2-like n=1 Tax=Penaeus vannamei TaxID=6689 RepID=A0A423TQX5_PENVA|nr:aspartate beta-hydroxylase domain-containing protein 2-like [Penaeus vannamei]ROT78860.1 putative aspartate beta-hydroxylase domain-containing protein 2-like [Penaeus vannamei]